jgi:hypothetical protein
MTAPEIAIVSQRLRERITAILTAQELAHYDAFRARVEAATRSADTSPVQPTPDEQRAIDLIAADRVAASLDQQLMVLLRIVTPPQ